MNDVRFGLYAVLAILITSAKPVVGGTIRQKLDVDVSLSKDRLSIGDRLTAHVTIKNKSPIDVTVVKIGWLYMAYWFGMRDSTSNIEAHPFFEKLFTNDVSSEDLLILKPGKAFTVERTATLLRPDIKSGTVLLDFGDSGFALRCGGHYRITGQFWAREDRSGRFKVTSGKISSRPHNLWINSCD